MLLERQFTTFCSIAHTAKLFVASFQSCAIRVGGFPFRSLRFRIHDHNFLAQLNPTTLSGSGSSLMPTLILGIAMVMGLNEVLAQMGYRLKGHLFCRPHFRRTCTISLLSTNPASYGLSPNYHAFKNIAQPDPDS
jgi:hypothetical protein